MELVPFHPDWTGSQTKLDLKGCYRRPAADGGIAIINALPLRRHMDWARKGFDYISLSTWADVSLVASVLQAEGMDISALRKSYKQGHPDLAVFDAQQYLATEGQRVSAYKSDLQAKVDKYGIEAVTDMMRVHDKSFVMPKEIEAPKRAGKVSA